MISSMMSAVRFFALALAERGAGEALTLVDRLSTSDSERGVAGGLGAYD